MCNCTSHAQPRSGATMWYVHCRGVVRVKAPGTARALGKEQPRCAILLVQPFLERPVVFWSTEPQPSAKQAKHMTDVKQLFPEMSAKRPRNLETLYFLL